MKPLSKSASWKRPSSGGTSRKLSTPTSIRDYASPAGENLAAAAEHFEAAEFRVSALSDDSGASLFELSESDSGRTSGESSDYDSEEAVELQGDDDFSLSLSEVDVEAMEAFDEGSQAIEFDSEACEFDKAEPTLFNAAPTLRRVQFEEDEMDDDLEPSRSSPIACCTFLPPGKRIPVDYA